jgi:two-component system, cell cycle response regulator
MNPELLDKVMTCRSLPTLPAVAARVVELTNCEHVAVRELAATIQNDMALSAKILRTVNSSLFGLRTPCSSINHAITLLGLSAVKTLALSFSLVSAIKGATPASFDLRDHWRRALYTGIAARQIATRARIAGAEEAFLGGLLQDLGVIALGQALGASYFNVIAPAKGDHRQITKLELASFQTQHADIGAMLAMRWKLPQQLVLPIKFHERASPAPVEFGGICRAVGLGNIAADVLTIEDPSSALRSFYQRAEQWFAISSLQADDILKLIAMQTHEAATLLSVPAGPHADAELIIAKAREQLALVTIDAPTSESAIQPDADPPGSDDLTGVPTRLRLEQNLVGAFEQAQAGLATLSVAIFEIDGADAIVEQYGQDAADTVMISVAMKLDAVFRPTGGMVSRYAAWSFGIAMPRTDRTQAARQCEAARHAVAAAQIPLIAAKAGAPARLSVTCSVGLASLDERTANRLDTLGALTGVVEQALAAARRAGPGSVRIYAPVQSAAA